MSPPGGRDASPRTVPPAAPAGYPPGLPLPVDARPYPPIGDYAFLGDCHAVALVSRLGSIDWCCLPRIDSASCFGRLLDWERGGYCAISPREPVAVRRDYLADSLVLETRLRGARGEARLLDFFAMRVGGRRDPRRQLIRIVEGLRGDLDLAAVVAPRFDYGAILPWVRAHDRGVWTALGGDAALVLSTDLPLALSRRHDLVAAFTLRAGERRRLSIEHRPPAAVHPGDPRGVAMDALDRRLDETLAWWRAWSARSTWRGPGRRRLLRSAAVIKGLVHAPSGAIAAAATTSLPESPGAGRNWDYRYTWIRDSTLALRSLAELGFRAEVAAFSRFIERTAADDVDGLQVLYGVCGAHRVPELVLAGHAGYRGSRPVRVGNAAAVQPQLDMYGDLLDLAFRTSLAGARTDDDYWRFLRSIVDRVAGAWATADRGIWEVRGRPRHFVHSKVLCWAALDRALRLAAHERRPAPVRDWSAARDDLRRAIEAHGVDRRRGVYVQAFGESAMDAALLLIPRVEFVAWDDPAMLRTLDAIRHELDLGGGLLLRYRSDDGLAGREGAFLPCSFWLVECLAHQGRIAEARAVFDRVEALAGELGLFAEEYDPRTGDMLGNFPQGLTHYSYITAAVALARARPPPRLSPPDPVS